MASILLVEDDDDIALALSIMLQRRGHRTARAPGGREGLRAAHADSPDLVLLDIGLPDIDGWEVLAGIRESSSVPVLMLTAAGREEDRARGLRSGADEYLTKPFRASVLCNIVDRLLAPGSESTRADPVREDDAHLADPPG